MLSVRIPDSASEKMDPDSTNLYLAGLVISVLIFAAISLVSASVETLRRHYLRLIAEDDPNASPNPFAESNFQDIMVPILRHVSITSTIVFIIALLLTSITNNWAIIFICTLIGTSLIIGLINESSKFFARRYSKSIIQISSPVIDRIGWFLSPIVKVSKSISNFLMRQNNNQSDKTTINQNNEITLQFDTPSEEIDEHEVRMIRAVFKLDKTTAREVMLPRLDIVAVDLTTPISELVENIMSAGHSRIPVYENSLDNVRGVAHARDILRHLVENNDSMEAPVSELMRPALFIPESKTLEELLNEFQQKRTHMAIVVDEYGGVSGLTTIEDVLEEIVGEIQDEFDEEGPEYHKINENNYLISASLSIDDLNELLDIHLTNNGFDTLGGYVSEQLGKIPSIGDICQSDGLRIEVVNSDNLKPLLLRVRRQL